MGLGPSKAKIKKILEEASCGNLSQQQDFIPCFGSFNQNPVVINEDQDNSLSIIESFIETSSMEMNQITDKKTEMPLQMLLNFPNTAFGTITATFPSETIMCTGFLINGNVLVTLASNLYDISKGGKCEEVISTFSPNVVKSEQIYFPEENKEGKKGELNLACILYDENVKEEWIGAEIYKSENNIDYNLAASCGKYKPKKDTDENFKSISFENLSELHQIGVNIKTQIKEDDNNSEKLAICRGGPVYYKDYSQNAVVVGFLDKDYHIQELTHKSMNFLIKVVERGKALKKKSLKNIDENKIQKLDLSRNDFGPLDIKYLCEFDLSNLVILDLSSNVIKPQGVFYLSQGKFPNLKSLNLNFNEIGDEGLNHLAKALFSCLEQLFLFHNNISQIGVQHLCKADFCSNLSVLSLSENKNIGDEGCKYINENKNWNSLTILNLNRAGLGDESIKLLISSAMPCLKKIHLRGNKFSKKVSAEIYAWKLNGIMIEYDEKKKKNIMGSDMKSEKDA